MKTIKITREAQGKWGATAGLDLDRQEILIVTSAATRSTTPLGPYPPTGLSTHRGRLALGLERAAELYFFDPWWVFPRPQEGRHAIES